MMVQPLPSSLKSHIHPYLRFCKPPVKIYNRLKSRSSRNRHATRTLTPSTLFACSASKSSPPPVGGYERNPPLCLPVPLPGTCRDATRTPSPAGRLWGQSRVPGVGKTDVLVQTLGRAGTNPGRDPVWGGPVCSQYGGVQREARVEPLLSLSLRVEG